MTYLQNILRQGVDMILPPRCVMTGEEVQTQGMIAPKAWSKLDFISAPLCQSCGVPFAFEVEEEAQCASCLKDTPPFKTARAALAYNDGSRNLILGFKHADKTHVVKAFTPWIMRAGADMIKESDILIPVPLHRTRLIARRYNQAALMVQILSKATGIKPCLDGLRRMRATPSQGYMTSKARAKNVKQAFAVPNKYKATIKNKTVILVDDVYTTGATVKECSKALHKAGAHHVHILTLARVVHPGFH